MNSRRLSANVRDSVLSLRHPGAEWRRPQRLAPAGAEIRTEANPTQHQAQQNPVYRLRSVGDGLALFAELEQRNLEGMVAKRIASQYAGGRTRDWLKIKTAAGKEEMRKCQETW